MTAKRALLWLGVIALVLLNWAALDDITTGNEPDFTLEWAIVTASVLLFGVWVTAKVWRRKSRS
jgi:hypothetical protein